MQHPQPDDSARQACVVRRRAMRGLWVGIVAGWLRFMHQRPEVRRVIDTTNALESVHSQLRKIIKTRGHFPNDEAATKLIWLALRNITAKWERSSIHWRAAMTQFAILYEGRFTTPNA